MKKRIITLRSKIGKFFPYRIGEGATGVFQTSDSTEVLVTEENDILPTSSKVIDVPAITPEPEIPSITNTEFEDSSNTNPMYKIPKKEELYSKIFTTFTAGALLGATVMCAGASSFFGYCTRPIVNPVSVNSSFLIPHDTPEILLPPTEEVGIFEYSRGGLLIHTKPKFGVSSYAATISGTDITELLSMSPEDQLSLVSKFDSDLRTYTSSALSPVLDLTIDIINDNSAIERPDTSYAGLRNPKRNVIHTDITLIVPVAFSPESPDLEEIVDNQGSVELPGLGKVIQDYFELKQIERDIPSVRDDLVMDEVARNIALQYNNSKIEGTQSMFDLSLYLREDRIDLASRLYRETNDRKSENYMTVEEILDLVNFGSEDKIKYNQVKGDFSRNDFNQRRIQERRQNILEDTLEIGYAKLTRKDILRLAKEYDVSERTIRRDLEKINLEAPEPYNLQNAQISA